MKYKEPPVKFDSHTYYKLFTQIKGRKVQLLNKADMETVYAAIKLNGKGTRRRFEIVKVKEETLWIMTAKDVEVTMGRFN